MSHRFLSCGEWICPYSDPHLCVGRFSVYEVPVGDVLGHKGPVGIALQGKFEVPFFVLVAANRVSGEGEILRTPCIGLDYLLAMHLGIGYDIG